MFSSVVNKAASVLKENRHVVNFTNYVTSDEHKKRLKTLPVRVVNPGDEDRWDRLFFVSYDGRV